MKTDRFSFALVSAVIVTGVILAFINPTSATTATASETGASISNASR